MERIYSIEFDTNKFVNPLTIDTIAREILEEHNNKVNIKSISYTRHNRCIMATSLKTPKTTIGKHYQEGIYITFYPPIGTSASA